MKNTKKHVVYSNYDVYSDENRESAIESILDSVFWNKDTVEVTDNYGKTVSLTVEEYRQSITEDQILNECNFYDETWFSDEFSMLKNKIDPKIDNGIIAIADLGLWNGRRIGYKEYSKLQDIMYSSCDYEEVYVDSYKNLRKTESHHDGTNCILYRAWKKGITQTQKENFMNKCYYGKIKESDISRYTENIGRHIAAYYGW